MPFKSQNISRRPLKFKSGAAGVKIKMVGKWKAANSMMRGMDDDIKAAYILSQVNLAKRLKKIVLGHIKNQDLGWPQLAESTLTRKAELGQGTMTYVATGVYKANIKIITRGTRIFVGIPKGLTDAKGNNYSDIASVMEYGAPARKNPQPARPLWQPSQKEITKKTAKITLAKNLSAIMFTKYGTKPKFR